VTTVGPVLEARRAREALGQFTAVRGSRSPSSAARFFGYLGANWAGKSTTIRILCGPARADVRASHRRGHDVATDNGGVRLSVGYMSQKFSLYPI